MVSGFHGFMVYAICLSNLKYYFKATTYRVNHETLKP